MPVKWLRPFRLSQYSSRCFHRLHSIAVQLFLLIFVSIVIPVLVGGYLSYEKSARMIEDQVSNVASLTIKQVRDNVNYNIKSLENTSMRILSNKMIQDALQAKAATPYESAKQNDDARWFLASLIMDMPEIMDIYVLDVNRQNSVLSSNLQMITNPWETDWYKMIVQADGRTLWFGLSDTSYLKGVDMGIPVFGLGRAVKDADTGRLLGVMFIEVRGKVLTDTLDDIQFGDTGNTFLTDRNNKFMYHRDAQLYGQASEFTIPDRMKVMTIKGKETMVIPAELSNGWRVTGIVPVQELVASSVEIRHLTIWIALASAVVAIVMGYYVMHKIGQPLVKLSKLMKRSEAGDLSVRFQITGRNEIGQLAQSFNRMIQQIEVLIERIAEEEREKKKAEIRALRYQINPHFLYNTLNSIRWMAKLHRTEEVANAISTLVQLLEASMERSGSIVKLGDELSLLEKYMIIQRYRYDHRIDLHIRCPHEMEDITMPRMLLQPIVENAIFHGIAPRESGDAGTIEVNVAMEGDDVSIVIQDDGVGIPADKIRKLLTASESKRKTGMTRIGLFHVHQTLQLYYGTHYGVQVTSAEGEGTSVKLLFPMRKGAAESDSEPLALLR